MEGGGSGDCSAKKRTIRRRCHTRKAPLRNSGINLAEARREIVNALQLHRSSSSSHSASNSINNNNNNNSPAAAATNCCYHHQSYEYYMNSSHEYVTEPIPNIAEPTWSTTAPAVVCAPVPPAMDLLEFEWFDSLSSSRSWWIGFLNSLDASNKVMDQEEGGSVGLELATKPASDESNVDLMSSPFNITDEWVIFPPTEEREQQQLV